jgi:putative DNA primase/helicase
LFGPPDGTKSTFISAVAAAFGDYAVTADFSTWLVQSNTGGNRGDLVALMGARLVTSVEVRKGAKFDESIMKRITGGDALTAAAKYEAEITFMPSFALWLAANDAPEARDDDEGFWRRVRRIPFTNPIPKARQDPDMPEKLRAPEVLQAILAWAVEGCLRWRTDGMGTCTAVEASTAAYRAEMDRAAGFFSDSCAFGKGLGYEVTNSELRVAYENWCEDNGMKPLSAKDFAGRLTARGCKPATKVKGNNRGWEGLRLQYPWQTQTN